MQDAADRESIHVGRTEHKQAKEDAAKTGHGRGTQVVDHRVKLTIAHPQNHPLQLYIYLIDGGLYYDTALRNARV